MTQDEIIRMAREAGSIDSEDVIETVWAAFAAAEQAEQEPVARVAGYYGGRCVVEPLNRATVLPTDMALYAAPQPVSQEPVAWIEGYPKDFYSEEWFIAITIYGDRVVLKALPENYSYDFTTADGTYMKKENVKRWMQFPDSEFLPPTVAAPVRTKDLTDDEIYPLYPEGPMCDKDMIDFARAVIAADREKNK